MSNSSLQVTEQNGDLVVDSRLIAARLNIEHQSFMKTLKRYQTRIEDRFGVVRFEIDKPIEGSQGGRPEKYALLTENQATTLMTFSKNTDDVVDCKLDLVAAFSEAKQIIKTVVPKQNDRIRELELANENMRLMLEWSTRQDNRITLHGLPIALMLEGKSDAVVEIEKPTIEVFDDRDGQQVKYVGQTCAQLKDYMKSRYGITFKSGKAVKEVLEAIEAQTGESLLGSAPRKIITDYVPSECSDKAIAYLRDVKNWQLLLGQ
jgi:phage regulator Rha-like protein